MAVLRALDGLKRVIMLVSYLVVGFLQAAGHGDHTPWLGNVFRILSWDPTDIGVAIGSLLQTGLTFYVIYDGVKKWWDERQRRRFRHLTAGTAGTAR